MGEDFDEVPALHMGQVSVVHIEKGFSFIKCSNSGYDKDIFVHKSVVDPSTWAVGDQVACSIEVSVKGNPKAIAPVWRMRGHLKPGTEPELGQYMGEIAEVNDQGNGFVQCDEIVQQYGKKAFCHSKVMASCELALGQVIAFSLHINAQGFPQVSAPCWINCSTVVAPAVMHDGKGAWHAGTREYPPAKMARTVGPQNTDEYFFGRVKLVDQSKGFSLIESPDSGYERDVYVKSLVAPPIVALNIDDVVAFKLHDNDGKPQALAPVWKLAGGEDCEIAPEMGNYVGRLVRKTNEGNGFVESEAITKDYARDTFIHFNVMQACGLEIGDTLLFNIAESARGQPQLQAPCWKCCSSENIPSTADMFGRPPMTNASHGGEAVREMSHQQKMAITAEKIDRCQKGIDKEVAMQAGIEREMAALRERLAKSKALEASLRVELAAAERVGLSLVGGKSAPSHALHSAPSHALHQDQSLSNDQQYYVGRIKRIDPAKECCYAECPDTGYAKDVYVHSRSVDPSLVQVGDVVAFPLHISAKGDPQASVPFWKLSGIWQESDVRFGDWFGKLRDPMPNGSSFVECEELQTQYGRQAYMHTSVIEQCSLIPGQLICFCVHVNQQGFPQATTPLWTLLSNENWKTPPLGPVVRSHPAAAMPPALMDKGYNKGKGKRKSPYDDDRSDKGKGKRKTTQDDLDGSYAVGWVQTVDEAKTYYLVEVPGAGFDRGIFMPFSIAQNLSVGDTVFFMLHLNKKNSLQASRDDVVWKLTGREPTGNVAEIGTYVGRLKDPNSHGGMHVVCPEVKNMYQQEAYVLKEVAEEAGFMPGDTIYFDIHLNHKGMPQVTSPCWKNASPYDPKSLDPRPDRHAEPQGGAAGGGGGTLTGVHTLARVKSISLKGSCSFFRAAHPEYPQDVYAHMKTVDPQMLALGDICFFQIYLSSRGQPQAAAPLWKMMGMVPSEFDAALVGTFKGKLEGQPSANGCVVVESKDVEEKFGSKAIVEADVMEETKIQPGDTIFFDVSGTNEEGTPQVSGPLWKCCSHEWLAPIGDSEQIRSSLDEVVGTQANLDRADVPVEQTASNDMQMEGDQREDANSQEEVPFDPRPARWTPQQPAEPPPSTSAPRKASPPRDPRRTKLEQSKAEGQDSSPVLGIPMVGSRVNSAGSQLKEGDIAVIHSLTSEAGKSLNNLKVTIMKVLDTGRMQVRFMPDANRPQDVRLKSNNLKPASDPS